MPTFELQSNRPTAQVRFSMGFNEWKLARATLLSRDSTEKLSISLERPKGILQNANAGAAGKERSSRGKMRVETLEDSNYVRIAIG